MRQDLDLGLASSWRRGQKIWSACNLARGKEVETDECFSSVQTHCDILPSGLCHRRLLLKGLRASFQSMGTHGYQGLHKPFNNSNSSSFNPAATSETSQTDLEAQRKSNHRGTKSLSSRSFTLNAATQRHHGQGHGQSQVYGQGARGWKR